MFLRSENLQNILQANSFLFIERFAWHYVSWVICVKLFLGIKWIESAFCDNTEYLICLFSNIFTDFYSTEDFQ